MSSGPVAQPRRNEIDFGLDVTPLLSGATEAQRERIGELVREECSALYDRLLERFQAEGLAITARGIERHNRASRRHWARGRRR